jgi:hypothetical protein
MDDKGVAGKQKRIDKLRFPFGLFNQRGDFHGG